MSTIFLGVRLPPKPYERIRIDNIELGENPQNLVYRAAEATKIHTDTIDLIYCGVILNNQQSLQEQGLKNGSIVNVTKKPMHTKTKTYSKITEADVQRIVSLFRSLETKHYHKASRPEIYEKILELYPDLINDICALSIIRDPIILSTLQNPETVRLFAEHHPELIDAAPIIIQQLKGKFELKQDASLTESVGDDHLSDSSSSSDNASPSTSNNRSIRRITSNQLAQALASIDTSNSVNSLANISQRNLSNDQPTSSNSAGTSGPITSSMVMNALSDILIRSGSTAANPENITDPETLSNAPVSSNMDSNGASTAEDQKLKYFAALNQMREMGLYDTETNLQALILCSGNIEAAINLVLSGMNN